MSKLPEDSEFERLLEEFALLISSRIRAFDHEKFGIDRDDLLQEIRFRIWRVCRERGRRQKIRNARAYVSKVVYTTVLKEIRKERTQRKATMQQAAGLSTARPGGRPPSEAEDDAPLREALSSALGELPPRNAEVIRLHLQGFTLEEIARFRGTTVFQARHHLYRGIEKLKSRIGIDQGPDEF